jgi:hypothetical protein
VVLTTREETKMPPRADLATFLYETSTDNAGFFSVAHELEIFEPDGFSIQGIVVQFSMLTATGTPWKLATKSITDSGGTILSSRV